MKIKPLENKMKAISLWQPWAGGIALGIKKLETRPRKTNIRGDVVICSTKKKVDPSLYPHNYKEVFDGCTPKEKELLEIKGHALCIVEIYSCVSTNTPLFTADITYGEQWWGDYSPNRHVWFTRNLRRIKPVPIKGGQGFFFLDKDLIQEIG